MHELSSNAHSIDNMRPWVVNSAPIQNKGLHDLGVNVHSINSMRPNGVKPKKNLCVNVHCIDSM